MQHRDSNLTHARMLEKMISEGTYIPYEQVQGRSLYGYTPVYNVPLSPVRNVRSVISILPKGDKAVDISRVSASAQPLGEPLTPKAPKVRQPTGYILEDNPTANLRGTPYMSRDQLVARFNAIYGLRGARGVSVDVANANRVNVIDETPAAQTAPKAETTAQRESNISLEATYTVETTTVREPQFAKPVQISHVGVEPCQIASAPPPSTSNVEATIPLSSTSVAGSSLPEAVVPPSTGDSSNLKALSIYRLITGSQKSMVEFALTVFSCHPDDVYGADSSLRGLAFRQGGFEMAVLPTDTPFIERRAFLDAFLAFYKDIARPCILKSSEISKYEQHFSPETLLSPSDYYDLYVVARKTCIDCGKRIGQSASSFQNIHGWAHHLFHRTFADLDMDDELSVREVFDGTKSNHTIKIKRNTSTLLLIRVLVAAQLFKLKLLSEEELMAGGLITGLGVFCPTFEALTTRQARISMVTRRLLSRARAVIATILPHLVESIIGPSLPSPLTEKKIEGDPVVVLPPKDVNSGSTDLSESTLTQQDQLSVVTQIFGASPTDLIRSSNHTQIRAKFRSTVSKILAKKRIEFKEILSQNQRQVESTRESLIKRPRDPILLGILEKSRVAQLKIDSSLTMIEKIEEEFQALSHLDDLPVMTTYNDDLDLESLPNSPVDLGTAFLAYMSRAKNTVGETEHIRVDKRDKRDKYRNYNSFVPTDKNGSFTRDMEAAVRNLKYEAAFVGATTITEKANAVEHKIRNDVSKPRRGPSSLQKSRGIFYQHRWILNEKHEKHLYRIPQENMGSYRKPYLRQLMSPPKTGYYILRSREKGKHHRFYGALRRQKTTENIMSEKETKYKVIAEKIATQYDFKKHDVKTIRLVVGTRGRNLTITLTTPITAAQKPMQLQNHFMG
ncbi:hypothetical protein ACOME3_000011 [Neoechinorhynchus agilis]